jgi:hypothetical protein
MSDISNNEADPVDVRALTRKLTEPFDPALIKFKPQVISGNRAMALAYIDARVIQDRLDDVLGVEGWQDDYEALPDGSVICRLKLKLGDKWITKVDVGGPSEQPDGGDRMKAAFSDALKRAAVKFGIGRYLYRLPNQWVDWDAQRRQFVQTPKLPAFAMPSKPAPLAALRTPSTRSTGLHTLPATGAELQKRLQDYDAKLTTQGLIERGDLLKHIQEAGAKAGYGTEITSWPVPAITLAVDQTKAFETQVRQRRAEHKEVA